MAPPPCSLDRSYLAPRLRSRARAAWSRGLVLVASKADARAESPTSKNILRGKGKVTELEGAVVVAENVGEVYVPRPAVNLIRAGSS